jgi:hypothetical protein
MLHPPKSYSGSDAASVDSRDGWMDFGGWRQSSCTRATIWAYCAKDSRDRRSSNTKRITDSVSGKNLTIFRKKVVINVVGGYHRS